MSKMTEKYQEHIEILDSIDNIHEYVEYCKADISPLSYDLVELLVLSEKFDESMISEFIETLSIDKSEDHYKLLLQYPMKFIQSFLKNNIANEMMNIMDKADVETIKTYIPLVNLSEEIYFNYFISKIDLDNDAKIKDNELFFENEKNNALYKALGIKYNIDKELEVYIELDMQDDDLGCKVIPNNNILNLFLKATKPDISSIFENMTARILTTAKSAMSHGGRVALTGALIMGISATAMAGGRPPSEHSFNENIDHINKIMMEEGSRFANSECQLHVEGVQATHGKGYSVKAILGDEEILIEKGSLKGNLEQTFAKTGKCKGLASNGEFKQFKESMTNTLKNIQYAK